jgi:ABC-type sulfate/molybdate transport systems ATPase subunit
MRSTLAYLFEYICIKGINKQKMIRLSFEEWVPQSRPYSFETLYEQNQINRCSHLADRIWPQRISPNLAQRLLRRSPRVLQGIQRRLHDDLHVTSIFVTHDQEEALEVADRVVLMNSGRVEQIGSPQQVWDHPASPFVYGFLGDVNLLHGRAHEGEMLIGGDNAVSLNSPEHQHVQDSKAFAYVRPHDIEVKRYSTGDAGIKAKLTRAIVVGPIARLEFEPVDHHDFAKDTVIEAQLSALLFAEQQYKEGETLVLTPRKARIFVES